MSCDGPPKCSMQRLTQLTSVEPHGVDGLPGPQDCVETSSGNPNHRPAFQHLGEHLHTQHITQTMKLKYAEFKRFEIEQRLSNQSLKTSYQNK